MHFPTNVLAFGALLSLTASASAMVAPRGSCNPGDYTCKTPFDVTGHNIYVCDSQGNWIVSADCGCDFCCQFYGLNHEPYCLSP
jgi:hypothetical protein